MNESMIEQKALELQVLENISMYKHGIFSMSNWQIKDSGLPYDIWFDDQGNYRKAKHKIPRVKIGTKNGNFIPISIDKKPKILLKGMQLRKAEKELNNKSLDIIFKFISINHKLILKHWNGEITTAKLFSELKYKGDVLI